MGGLRGAQPESRAFVPVEPGGPSERYAVKTGRTVAVPWGILRGASRSEEQSAVAGVTVPKTAAGALGEKPLAR